MTTVVLGWDGLDDELVRQFDLRDAFGAHVRPIETIVNPVLDKPHTWELWPSIITGQHPNEHGIHAHEYIETNWSNPLVRWAARLSEPIPDSMRWRVGRWLRDAGAEMAFESADYYNTTVFDAYRSFPLAIPNYRTAFDDRYGMSVDRGAELGAYLNTQTDESGETRRTPAVAPETFAGQIAADAGEKIALARHAIAQDYDLIFLWLAYLDTAGHVAPTLSDPDAWMRQHYQQAADWTALIRDALGDDDVLMCLSDHGLQDGEHTRMACVGAWPARVAVETESVLDVADTIDAFTTASEARHDAHSTADGAVDEVRENLQALGYVD